jgi:hypothetical protein
MQDQQTFFNFAVEKMDEHSVFKFYGDKKTPHDAVEAGAKTLSSIKATQLRGQAFSSKDTLQELNSPTFCSAVDGYVPFWWAVKNYPKETFEAWEKRADMAAALQKKQFVFMTTAQLYLGGVSDPNQESLLPEDYYTEELSTKG